MIQHFLNSGDICQFLFRFKKYFKGYGIPGSPIPGPHKWFRMSFKEKAYGRRRMDKDRSQYSVLHQSRKTTQPFYNFIVNCEFVDMLTFLDGINVKR